MGLALHAKAGRLIEKEEYKEALEVLELAEVGNNLPQLGSTRAQD